MPSFQIRNFIRTPLNVLVEDHDQTGVSACHVAAPPDTIWRYRAVMPEKTHVISVYFQHSLQHRLVVDDTVLIEGPLPDIFICFLPAGTRVEANVTNGFDILQMFMPSWWIEGLAQKIQRQQSALANLRCDPFVCSDPGLFYLARAILESMRGFNEDQRLLEFRTMAEAFATRLVAEHMLVPGDRGRSSGLSEVDVKRVRRYVEDHLDTPLRVELLANLTGQSLFHFTRAFKRATGFPPYRYIQDRRMRRALELLRNSNLSIGSVAAAVGYEDPSHFAGVFRRTFGSEPRRVRQSDQLSSLSRPSDQSSD